MKGWRNDGENDGTEATWREWLAVAGLALGLFAWFVGAALLDGPPDPAIRALGL